MIKASTENNFRQSLVSIHEGTLITIIDYKQLHFETTIIL